jgi:hypothetical protein
MKVFIFLLALAGCTRGVPIELCLLNPIGAECQYKNRAYHLTDDALLNYFCISPDDAEEAYLACINDRPFYVSPCIMGKDKLSCPSSFLPRKDAVNYICTDPQDWDFFLNYCKTVM